MIETTTFLDETLVIGPVPARTLSIALWFDARSTTDWEATPHDHGVLRAKIGVHWPIVAWSVSPPSLGGFARWRGRRILKSPTSTNTSPSKIRAAYLLIMLGKTRSTSFIISVATASTAGMISAADSPPTSSPSPTSRHSRGTSRPSSGTMASPSDRT